MNQLLKDTKELIIQYEKDVNNFHTEIDQSIIASRIPKIVSKYQTHYRDLLNEYTRISDMYDEFYHQELKDYKLQVSDLSILSSINSTELKTLIETSEKGRKFRKYLGLLKNDMKTLESMIETIKNHNFNISNMIKFKELIGGA